MSVAAALSRTALRLGGTVSGAHGTGLGKQRAMAEEHRAALADLRAIKQAFDCHNILNPGTLLPPTEEVHHAAAE